MNTFNNIATLIRVERRAVGLSQVALSHALGYKNGQLVSNIERGLCSLPLKNIRKAAKVLCMDPEKIKDAMVADYGSRIYVEMYGDVVIH